ncbi:MAG: ATP-binding protein [Actinomycetota bacterium]
MKTCPTCGEQGADRARFCQACGAPLPEQAPAHHEVRKTVSVVFADMTGSTALGERLDPEMLRRVMTRYYEEMRAAIERHGGTVEKFIGDAVMAVFGIPSIHEDDALRAVRAAIDMREALEQLNEELERDRGVQIQIRTGVNTGEVVAGVSADALATGDAVNVAARFEQAAQPEEILIGEETYRLVRDAVDVEPVEPLALKGKTEPIAAYRLLGVRAGAPAHARRLDAPMVGRAREKQIAMHAFERTIEDRTCHLLTILGSAGVGKSRLAAEIVKEVGSRATVLTGRCLPYGEGITYWPVREVIAQAAGFGESDPPQVVRTRIAGLLDGDEHTAMAGERLVQLFGLSESASDAKETAWAVRRLLETTARKHPLVAVFDDIHWAEPAFLDLIEHVADWVRDAPILMVCIGRLELLDDRPGWGGGKMNATSFLLEPLDSGDCERLIENLLGRTDLPSELRLRITESSEGNPLFVEEMVGMLIDEDVLHRTDGGWVANGDLSRLKIPASIGALLAARLDRLNHQEKAVIEGASVVGKVFWGGAVGDLCAEPVRSNVSSTLMSLVRKELIRPEPSTFASEEAFAFRHILIRDAAYQTMPKELRADLHERFADWLERASGERVAENDEILGYHLEQARAYRLELGIDDERTAAIGERAGRRLWGAGVRAFARGDSAAATNLVERSIDLLPRGSRLRAEIAISLALELADMGDFDRSGALLDELEASPVVTADTILAGRTRLARIRLSDQIDPSQSAAQNLAEAQTLIAALEKAGDVKGQIMGWILSAFAWWTEAQAAKTEAALAKAYPLARASGAARMEILILVWYAYWAVQSSAPIATMVATQERIEERKGLSRRLEVVLHHLEAMIAAFSGDLSRAEEIERAAQSEWLDMGMAPNAAMSYQEIAEILISTGDAAHAESLVRPGCDRLRELGESAYLSTLVATLAGAVAAQGRFSEAVGLTEESERLAARDDVVSQIGWRRARASAFAGLGDEEGAVALAQQAIDLSNETDFPACIAGAHETMGSLLRALGRGPEAVQHFRRALEVCEQKGSSLLIAALREQIRDVEGRGAA